MAGPLKDAITEVHVSNYEEEKNVAHWVLRGQQNFCRKMAHRVLLCNFLHM